MDKKTLRTLQSIAKEDLKEIVVMIAGEPASLRAPTKLQRAKVMLIEDGIDIMVAQVRACFGNELTADEVFSIMQIENFFGTDPEKPESELRKAVLTLWGIPDVTEDEAAEAGEDPNADANFTQPGNSESESATG